MRGTVIGYDRNSHRGAITGVDGERYEFVTLSWRDTRPPRAGMDVDFSIDGRSAMDIFVVGAPAGDTSRAWTGGAPAGFSWGWFLFSVTGRIPRYDYWMKFVLPAAILGAVIGAADATGGTMYYYYDPATGMSFSYGLYSSLYGLLLIWPGIAVGAKRCHDRGKTGWFQAIILIPVLGVIWLLVELGFLRGTPGDNRYGPDPLEGRA